MAEAEAEAGATADETLEHLQKELDEERAAHKVTRDQLQQAEVRSC